MWEFFLKDGTKRLGDGWNNDLLKHSFGKVMSVPTIIHELLC